MIKSLVAAVILSLPAAAETLEMGQPLTSAASGLEVTVMPNVAGMLPVLAQYAPRLRSGVMVLIKKSTAQEDTDTYLITFGYLDGGKSRQVQTVVARLSGVNSTYTSAVVWVDAKSVQWVSITQGRTMQVSVQFGPTAQFEILGDAARFDAASPDPASGS